MNSFEEELQKDLEDGRISDKGEPLDVKAYQQVFQAIQKPPSYRLPNDFARRVVARMNEQQQSRFSSDYLWFALGMLFLATAFVATIMITGFKVDLGFLKTMEHYSGLAIFGAAFIVLLNWLDKRLLKNREVEA